MKQIPVPEYIADHVRRTKAIYDAIPDRAPDDVLIDPTAGGRLRGYELITARGD